MIWPLAFEFSGYSRFDFVRIIWVLHNLIISEIINRYGVPGLYITIHRADLQNVLYEKANNNPLIDIKLDEKVIAVPVSHLQTKKFRSNVIRQHSLQCSAEGFAT